MDRRQFLKYGSLAVASAAVGGGVGAASMALRRQPRRRISTYSMMDLSIGSALVPMIDDTNVFMWTFEAKGLEKELTGPGVVPGPVIQAVEGDSLELTITNTLAEDHAFAIPGVIDSGIIPPGESKKLEFDAPTPGTYLYHDPLNAPVNRVLGLHGVMVVMPKGGNTPYNNPTPTVQRLFDDLGKNKTIFPDGKPWDARHQTIWLFGSVDPAFNKRAEAGERIDPLEFVRNFLPRYHTINGRSGFDITHSLPGEKDSVPRGRLGEPMLIRVVNAGMPTHSPHIHGNHVYVIARDGRPLDSVMEKDTWISEPLSRTDVLLPFRRPPDIPDGAWPPKEEFEPQFTQNTATSKDILRFPMHCHTEPSQTAAGGNYPQGLLTDWHLVDPGKEV